MTHIEIIEVTGCSVEQIMALLAPMREETNEQKRDRIDARIKEGVELEDRMKLAQRELWAELNRLRRERAHLNDLIDAEALGETPKPSFQDVLKRAQERDRQYQEGLRFGRAGAGSDNDDPDFQRGYAEGEASLDEYNRDDMEPDREPTAEQERDLDHMEEARKHPSDHN